MCITITYVCGHVLPAAVVQARLAGSISQGSMASLPRASSLALLLSEATAPYSAGATLGRSWACGWQTDWSAYAVHGLGLAGTTPTTQTPVGPHTSAEACERWCCETEHLSKGPDVPGGWEATPVATGFACDGWQFMSLSEAGNGGCWVSIADGNGGRPLSIEPALTAAKPTAKGAWIGATGCLRFRPWGVSFLLLFGSLTAGQHFVAHFRSFEPENAESTPDFCVLNGIPGNEAQTGSLRGWGVVCWQAHRQNWQRAQCAPVGSQAIGLTNMPPTGKGYIPLISLIYPEAHKEAAVAICVAFSFGPTLADCWCLQARTAVG